MEFQLSQYLLIGVMSFAAGFIDSIAGGGGLISLPAYISIGVPPHFALGTNKLSSTCGTSFAVFRFFRHGSIDPRVALFSAAGALVGSPLGAALALVVDEGVIKALLIVLLPVVAFFVLFKKDFGLEDRSGGLSSLRIALLSAAVGLSIGMYDGFFGPGTGTFLILAFTGLLGLSLVKASGNAKVVNLSSNVGALVTFLLNGRVFVVLGLVAAVFNIAGNWIGSGLAIKRGAKVIRPVFVVSVSLLLAKILWDMAGDAG
jgi:uncharacterized membrane protein YfcA